MVLSSWNVPQDLETYGRFAKEFTRSHPGTRIDVSITPGSDFHQWMTTRLAADRAPDIVRITPQQFGRYAANGGVVDISSALPDGYSKPYRQNIWDAVVRGGRVYGIPQHTDTMAIYYHREVLAALGVTAPGTVEQAWRWPEFMEIAREVKRYTRAYGFSFGFEGMDTSYRWLPVLYMHGGRLLREDMRTPAINEPEGIEALEWTQRWYREGLISSNNTVKGSTGDAAIALFTTGQAGLMLHLPTPMQSLPESIPDEKWDVTYMFQDVTRASDFGGNFLAVTHSCDRPDLAGAFIALACDHVHTLRFCRAGGWIPVRRGLTADEVGYAYRPEVVQRFIDQADTVPDELIALETGETFARIVHVLADYLDLCFVGGVSAKQTAEDIADGIRYALA